MAKKKNGTLLAKKTLVNEQPRILKYFPNKVQEEVARNSGNIETQRDILMNHVQSKHPGMGSIFNNNYYREVDEFIEFVESKNIKLVEEAQAKKLGFKPGKKIKFSKSKKDSKIGIIQSKTKKGKTYTRAKTKSFENKNITSAFIKKRVKEGKSNKEITSDYNKFAKSRGWQERTVSSITTYKSRNKIKSKK